MPDPFGVGIVVDDAELVLTRVIWRRMPGIALNTRVITEPSACVKDSVTDPRQRSNVTLRVIDDDPGFGCELDVHVVSPFLVMHVVVVVVPGPGSDECDVTVVHVMTSFSVKQVVDVDSEDDDRDDDRVRDVGPTFMLKTVLPCTFTSARQFASSAWQKNGSELAGDTGKWQRSPPPSRRKRCSGFGRVTIRVRSRNRWIWQLASGANLSVATLFLLTRSSVPLAMEVACHFLSCCGVLSPCDTVPEPAVLQM